MSFLKNYFYNKNIHDSFISGLYLLSLPVILAANGFIFHQFLPAISNNLIQYLQANSAFIWIAILSLSLNAATIVSYIITRLKNKNDPVRFLKKQRGKKDDFFADGVLMLCSWFVLRGSNLTGWIPAKENGDSLIFGNPILRRLLSENVITKEYSNFSYQLTLDDQCYSYIRSMLSDGSIHDRSSYLTVRTSDFNKLMEFLNEIEWYHATGVTYAEFEQYVHAHGNPPES